MSASTNQDQLNIRIEQLQLSSSTNLPSADLIEGSRENYVKIGVPLYEASIKGDWKVAEAILKKQPHLIRFAITENYETPLHIAASAKRTKHVEEFVNNLVRMMEEKDLELQNKSQNTALSLAAAAGNVKTAAIMVEKNAALLEIPGSQGMRPLYLAALFGKNDMAKYLYEKSRNMSSESWTNYSRGLVLQKCVENGIFDVALRIVNDRPELLTERNILGNVLSALARNTEAFEGVKPNIFWRIIKSFCALFHWEIRPHEKDCEALKLLKIFWENIAMMPKNEIDDIITGRPTVINLKEITTEKFYSRVLFVAAKKGNTRFIVELIRLYPDLIWKVDERGRSIFHIAIKRRHESIYNLLHEIGPMKDLITPLKDHDGNNMLHLVGKSAWKIRKQDLPGVALHMQRELLWYKEVEQMIPPDYKETKNNDSQTPYDLFTLTHEKHVAQGEQWMKDTASQCMVVAALIATIVFGAAFIIPGGYDQNTGAPNFHNIAFMVFVISDAISLIFSSTSVLMFVSILTSIYAENGFLESLPKLLMFGLATLLLSVVTMMLSFSASFFALYHKNMNWLPIFVTGLASMPVILFATLQFPLLVKVFYSTYRSTYLFRPKTHKLY